MAGRVGRGAFDPSRLAGGEGAGANSSSDRRLPQAPAEGGGARAPHLLFAA